MQYIFAERKDERPNEDLRKLLNKNKRMELVHMSCHNGKDLKIP